MDETIDILGQNISKDIYSAVKKATAHLRNKDTLNQKHNNFSITEQELKDLVESKATKADLQK